jgi:hypothetical protein
MEFRSNTITPSLLTINCQQRKSFVRAIKRYADDADAPVVYDNRFDAYTITLDTLELSLHRAHDGVR